MKESAGRMPTLPSVQLRAADAGEFFVGGHVDDFECFRVETGVRAEVQFPEVTLFQFDEELFIFSVQALQDRGVYDDAELEVRFVACPSFQNLPKLTLNFDAHGQGALNLATAFAIQTIVIDGGMDAF